MIGKNSGGLEPGYFSGKKHQPGRCKGIILPVKPQEREVCFFAAGYTRGYLVREAGLQETLGQLSSAGKSG